MKRLTIICLAVLAFTSAFAQKTFYGTLTYDYKMMGEGAEMAAAFSPTSMDIIAGKKGTIVRMNGGMMASLMGDILTTSKGSYMVNHTEEVVYTMDTKSLKDEVGAVEEPAVEKMEEVIEIMGYECQKYKVTSDGEMGEMTNFLWITDKFQLPSTSKGSQMGQSISATGVPGVALKTMTNVMGMTIVQTVIEIDDTKPKGKLFKLPKKYEQKPLDMNSMFGGMGGGM